jgi:sugar/nucleoside kinase (ribokinase family)
MPGIDFDGLRRQFLREAEQFLDERRDDPGAARPSVFVGGKLTLDAEIRIDMPFAEWLAALRASGEKVRHRWSVARRGLGGFPAHAARTARAKGLPVVLGAALPRRWPRALQGFLDLPGVRPGPAPAYAGPMPHTLVLVFADGTHRLLIDPGPETPPAALLPPAGCDVVLVNPGGAAGRRPLLSFFRRLADREPRPVVGLVGRDDWAPEDWEALAGSGAHVFLNRRELEDSLGAGPGADPARLLARLRPWAGGCTVTLTLGADGALVLGGDGELVHVPAAQVEARRLCGAGDVFCTTALLALARNHPRGHAALLAAMEAARWVSGRPPATSLAELDDEVRRRPEMTARPVPFPAQAA